MRTSTANTLAASKNTIRSRLTLAIRDRAKSAEHISPVVIGFALKLITAQKNVSCLITKKFLLNADTK